MALSLGGAFVSGLVGVGGAVVMIPLLLYVPPLVGVGKLDVRTASAVPMVQAFFAAFTAALVHRRRRALRPNLATLGVLAMAARSLTFALASNIAVDYL